MQSKHRYLIAIAATAVASGLLLPLEPTRGVAQALGQLPSVLAWVFLYCWYRADAMNRRFAGSTTFNGLVISLSAIALPTYFFRTRGALRGLAATALFYLAALAWTGLAGLVLGIRMAADGV